MIKTVPYEKSFEYICGPLLKYWHPTKNGTLKPSEIMAHSNTIGYWKGECGHEWEAKFNAATNGLLRQNHWGCPYCDGRKLLKGFNDLQSQYPEIAKYFDLTKNDIKPDEILPHSKTLVWWKKECGHEWQASPQSIFKHGAILNCPICNNRKFMAGVNDVATKYPDLIAEWHPTKNKTTPDKARATQQSKYWWLCEKGHEWEAVLGNRIKGAKCPYCANKKVLPNETDLQTKYPEIKSYWNYEKNNGLLPNTIPEYYDANVWFICDKGHEWQEKPRALITRTQYKCPVCAGKNIEEVPLLIKEYPEIAKEWMTDKNADYDINTVKINSAKKYWWKCKNGHEWKIDIKARIKAPTCPYCTQRTFIPGVNDLMTLYPNLAKELHPTKNQNISPSDIYAKSTKQLWWICSKGHEWKNSVHNRTIFQECPYCAGKYAIPGQTDIVTVNPEIASEWHPTKNGDLKPETLLPGSQKKVWWKCKNGHEWQAHVFARIINNHQCPYCTNTKVLAGFNDLETLRPDIAKEWHPTKNDNLMPSDVTVGNGTKVWWKCSEGHEWKMRINRRTHDNKNCPYCSNTVSYIKSTNDDFKNAKIKHIDGEYFEVQYSPTKSIIITYDQLKDTVQHTSA